MSSSSVRSPADTAAATVHSCLWAAWADALGWITELTDAAGVARRLGDRELSTVQWRRRIGGQSGVTTALPAGTWSDDTQLRMAVARCIGQRGFDVEVFSKVELPVWPSYAFGGGFASKAAAAALGKPGSRWSSAGAGRDYATAGGNGAAMRAQAHAWLGPQQRADEWLLMDVMKDSVSTHGHPRAILGAGLQALAVSDLIHGVGFQHERSHERWRSLIRRLSVMSRLPDDDMELQTAWLSQWTDATGSRWGSAVDVTLSEMDEHFSVVTDVLGKSRSFDEGYDRCVAGLELTSEKERGSGSRTSVAALAVWALALEYGTAPDLALTKTASVLATDTDTIATMAGALLGAIWGSEPVGEISDREYLIREAHRLADPRIGPPPVRHPDLVHWVAPKTQADAYMIDSETGQPYVSGLGPAVALSDPQSGNSQFAWQWVKTAFGQTLFIKRRQKPAQVRPSDRAYVRATDATFPDVAQTMPEQAGRPDVDAPGEPSNHPQPSRQVPPRSSLDDRRREYERRQTAEQAEQERRRQAAARDLEKRKALEAQRASRTATDPGEAIVRARRRAHESKYDGPTIGGIFVYLVQTQGPEIASAFAALVARDVADEFRRDQNT